MTMPAPAHVSPDHDETLIARLAAADLTDREAGEARVLVASCPACAELHVDLRSIMTATASLPAPRRTRDFRLTDADGARLHRTGWRRLLGRFGEPRLAFTKPLATGLVTLGIAGLVFAVAPSFLATGGLSSSASTAAPAFAPAPRGAGAVAGPSEQGTKQDAAASSAASAAASAAASSAGSVQVPSTAAASIPVSVPTSNVPIAGSSAAPSGAPTALSLGPERASASPAAPPDSNFSSNTLASGAAPPPGGPSPLFVASVVLLALGIGLFLLRWAARRPG